MKYTLLILLSLFFIKGKAFSGQLINEYNFSSITDGLYKLEDGRIYLLDGHHRQQAMLILYEEEDFDVPIEITVHCYKSDTINSSRTSSLFHKLNNTKPFSVGPVVTITVIQIIDYLETHYPGMIRDTSTRANYPNIHKKTLNKCLYEHLN